MNFKERTSQLFQFFDSKKGRKVLNWANQIIFIGIVLWLIRQLANIGWAEVWEDLPAQPLFYVFFFIAYVQLPIFEVWMYRLSWKFDTLASIPTFLIKRIYNKDVLGYSGEVYFFSWAQKYVNVPAKEIITTIKDNNIVSSVASTLFSIALLSIFVFTGQVRLEEWIDKDNYVYWALGVFFAALLIALVFRFRHYVIQIPGKIAMALFGIQMVRLSIVQILNLAMFYVVLPEIPFYVWFTYLSIEIILTRIPFIPNRDFIFVGMTIGLAGTLSVDESGIAALMLTRGVLGKIASFLFYGIFSIWKPKQIPLESAAIQK